MIITNYLDASQSAQAADLEALCKQYEPLQGSAPLSNEFNFDTELPCFYLLYNPDDEHELIAFLSIFVPSPDTAEVSAYTSPSWRQQGCFNTLFEAALQTLQEYDIEHILFVHEPVSTAAAAVLETLEAEYQYSEYFMNKPANYSSGYPTDYSANDTSDYTLPQELALLSAAEQELPALSVVHALAFQESEEASQEFLSNVFAISGSCVKKLIHSEQNELLGICCFTIGRNEISIFGVAIHPSQQRKGYASAMLQAVLKELANDYPQHRITLQVNSRNEAAYALYRKLGFEVGTEFAYSYVGVHEALELF